jgi:hypothetical protein
MDVPSLHEGIILIILIIHPSVAQRLILIIHPSVAQRLILIIPFFLCVSAPLREILMNLWMSPLQAFSEKSGLSDLRPPTSDL